MTEICFTLFDSSKTHWQIIFHFPINCFSCEFFYDLMQNNTQILEEKNLNHKFISLIREKTLVSKLNSKLENMKNSSQIYYLLWTIKLEKVKFIFAQKTFLIKISFLLLSHQSFEAINLMTTIQFSKHWFNIHIF